MKNKIIISLNTLLLHCATKGVEKKEIIAGLFYGKIIIYAQHMWT